MSEPAAPPLRPRESVRSRPVSQSCSPLACSWSRFLPGRPAVRQSCSLTSRVFLGQSGSPAVLQSCSLEKSKRVYRFKGLLMTQGHALCESAVILLAWTEGLQDCRTAGLPRKTREVRLQDYRTIGLRVNRQGTKTAERPCGSAKQQKPDGGLGLDCRAATYIWQLQRQLRRNSRTDDETARTAGLKN